MTELPEPTDLAFNLQIRVNENMGSPFTAAVLELIRADATAGGVFRDLLAPFDGLDFEAHMKAATPLRPLGWVHELALSGEEPELTALYPPAVAEADRAALADLLPQLARKRFDAAAAFLTSPPQTNEVRRTLCLLGGFTTVAQETGLPLRLFEIGASAGLNLNWNRFRYQLGKVGVWGDPQSPVTIAGDWTGPLPPLGPVEVAHASGCDISPVDVRDPARALRLEAYVWADQRDRVERLRGAIALARSSGVDLVRADAGEWVEQNVRPVPGVATVLYHSVMWQYMPEDTQARIEMRMASMAELATPEAPLAWLGMEPGVTIRSKMELNLSLWPNGGRRRLALVHPHGAAVDWGSAE